ncbi:MAG: phosphoribosyl-AMP cyclohydrolase [Armatimonadia bacterium]
MLAQGTTNMLIDDLKFDDNGLIPAIAQDAETGEVLMVAWMNAESFQATVETGNATYWSRSRQKFWVKGESSGHLQKVKWIRTDCDKDVLLLGIEQVGVACHTGRRSCFFYELRDGAWETICEPEVDPDEIYKSK